MLIFTNIYCIIILIRINYLQLLQIHKQCYRGGITVDKEKYEQTELEIIVFQRNDIITTSEEDEVEMISGY